jgi:hypothetical protein
MIRDRLLRWMAWSIFPQRKSIAIAVPHKTFTNGKTRYSHKAVMPVIVSPKQSSVIPLAPEFITPQDGHDKQDCEIAAALYSSMQRGLTSNLVRMVIRF